MKSAETVLALHGLQPLKAEFNGNPTMYAIGKLQVNKFSWWGKSAGAWSYYGSSGPNEQIEVCEFNETHLRCYERWSNKGMPLP